MLSRQLLAAKRVSILQSLWIEMFYKPHLLRASDVIAEFEVMLEVSLSLFFENSPKMKVLHSKSNQEQT